MDFYSPSTATALKTQRGKDSIADVPLASAGQTNAWVLSPPLTCYDTMARTITGVLRYCESGDLDPLERFAF